jgi:hypothetical protein
MTSALVISALISSKTSFTLWATYAALVLHMLFHLMTGWWLKGIRDWKLEWPKNGELLINSGVLLLDMNTAVGTDWTEWLCS